MHLFRKPTESILSYLKQFNSEEISKKYIDSYCDDNNAWCVNSNVIG